MIDALTCELELSESGVPEGIIFQTKDLFCYGGHLTITRQGRLIEWGKYRDPESRRDLDYHGDIRFYRSGAGGEFLEYVARFTHGQIEWLRSVSELPEPYLRMMRAKN